MSTVLQQPFAEQFREPDTPYLSPVRIGACFGFKVQELAERAHVHRNTPTARPHAPQLQKYLQDMVRALAVATEMTGDENRAAFLLRNEPLRAFGYNGLGRITGTEVGSVGGGAQRGPNSGTGGLLRLFTSVSGGMVSWLIPAALILTVFAFITLFGRPRAASASPSNAAMPPASPMPWPSCRKTMLWACSNAWHATRSWSRSA